MIITIHVDLMTQWWDFIRTSLMEPVNGLTFWYLFLVALDSSLNISHTDNCIGCNRIQWITVDDNIHKRPVKKMFFAQTEILIDKTGSKLIIIRKPNLVHWKLDAYNYLMRYMRHNWEFVGDLNINFFSPD